MTASVEASLFTDNCIGPCVTCDQMIIALIPYLICEDVLSLAICLPTSRLSS
jgi:hypothetical protein